MIRPARGGGDPRVPLRSPRRPPLHPWLQPPAPLGTNPRIWGLPKIQVRAVSNDSVYSLALIPRRRKKSPVPPPGQPYGHTAELCKTGELILKWKCPNPERAEGTIYNIHRQLGHNAPMVHLACVGQRQFTDDTIPPGTPIVHYQITAGRSTGEGGCATFVVKFGGGMPKEGRFIPRKAA